MSPTSVAIGGLEIISDNEKHLLILASVSAESRMHSTMLWLQARYPFVKMCSGQESVRRATSPV
jgi:hypothetical protein